MDFDEYQKRARSFAVGGGLSLEYAMLGLAEEAGEACGKVAKFIRKHNLDAETFCCVADEDRHALMLELGDVLWMLANAAACIGYRLGDVAAYNINKIEGRAVRGTIIGEGDER